MEKINETLEKSMALDEAITLINWDLETEAPKMALERTSKLIGFLSAEKYAALVNDDFKNLVYSVNTEELSELDRKIVAEIKKEVFAKMEKIPKDEYREYSELIAVSTRKWEEAKVKNDFSIFKDYLSKVIETSKKFIKYIGYSGHPYNTLLDDYEPEMFTDELDNFFNRIKNELSPFIKKLMEEKREIAVKDVFRNMKFDTDRQKELSEYVLNIIKFDFGRGILKESEHPFTTSIGNRNVRITTHYYDDRPLSAMYSTIHEGGHALYEQNIGDEITETLLGTGTSMGIHESQSRIFENMFGRSREFLMFLYPEADRLFNLKENGISGEDFYRLANEAEKSLIRVEADELTYPIHILIRYELEKEIFGNLEKETDVDELAEKWADKYEQYLGIRPVSYSEGILQDIHWAQGLFGYFPSYALGSAYAAQIYSALNSKIDIASEMLKGEFSEINEILKENIHKYGKTKTPKELIRIMTGEDFNPEYYINYLTEKFSGIFL